MLLNDFQAMVNMGCVEMGRHVNMRLECRPLTVDEYSRYDVPAPALVVSARVYSKDGKGMIAFAPVYEHEVHMRPEMECVALMFRKIGEAIDQLKQYARKTGQSERLAGNILTS